MSSAIPIRSGTEPNIPMQFSRNSFAHSQGMGGISWGGASVGSWLRDEVLMATKHREQSAGTGSFVNSSLPGSHYTRGFATAATGGGSSSVADPNDILGMSPDHAAYFPSIEANFCKDYSCCGNLLPTLHDLLRHYEEQHISQSPVDEPPVMRRMQNIETVSTNDVFLPFDQPSKDDMAGLGLDGDNSGFDGAPGIDDLDLGLGSLQDSSLGNALGNTPQAFAPPSFQPLGQPSMGGMLGLNRGRNAMGGNRQSNNVQGQTINDEDSGSGGASGTRQQLQQQQQSAGNAAYLAGYGRTGSGGFNANFGGNMSHSNNRMATRRSDGDSALMLGDDEEPTIDDPARQLYMLEHSENKPFKCPVIGCEKTYKNQNGLKYHRQHGHQNQTLHLNDDGTYSIIDPLSNTPYPDGMGMEKDKPYRCEICGKRYKNLNGLKYHRAHSTH